MSNTPLVCFLFPAYPPSRAALSSCFQSRHKWQRQPGAAEFPGSRKTTSTGQWTPASLFTNWIFPWLWFPSQKKRTSNILTSTSRMIWTLAGKRAWCPGKNIGFWNQKNWIRFSILLLTGYVIVVKSLNLPSVQCLQVQTAIKHTTLSSHVLEILWNARAPHEPLSSPAQLTHRLLHLLRPTHVHDTKQALRKYMSNEWTEELNCEPLSKPYYSLFWPALNTSWAKNVESSRRSLCRTFSGIIF